MTDEIQNLNQETSMAKRRKKRDENGTPVSTIGGSIDQVMNGAQANGNGHANGHAELPDIRFSYEACETILDARRQLQDTLDDMNAAKRELREKRAAFETATESLTRAIDEARQPNLFNRDGTPKQAPSEAIPPDVEGKPLSSFTPPADDESWRVDSIDVLDLKEALADKLRDASIYTLGNLQDYTDPAKNGGNPHKRITDVAGIGVAAAQKIEEAFTAYWANRPAPAAAPEAPPAEGTAMPADNADLQTQTSADPAIPESRDSLGTLNADGVRCCRVCKCTEANCEQCIEALGQPCTWSEADPSVCTRCEIEGNDKPAKPKRAAKSRGEKKGRRKKEGATA